MSASQLTALLLADGRLPTGGHAQSAGLEPALADGLPPDRIGDYLLARLHTVARVDAATAVLARRHTTDGEELFPLLQAYDARVPSAPLREASAALGRGLLRLAVRLWPEAPALASLRDLPACPRPIVLGAIASTAGLDDLTTARTTLYDDVQSAAYAAPKLLPVDPAEPVGWVLALADAIERVAVEATAVTGLADLPATTAPQVEQWSLDQRNRTRRIFHA